MNKISESNKKQKLDQKFVGQTNQQIKENSSNFQNENQTSFQKIVYKEPKLDTDSILKNYYKHSPQPKQIKKITSLTKNIQQILKKRKIAKPKPSKAKEKKEISKQEDIVSKLTPYYLKLVKKYEYYITNKQSKYSNELIIFEQKQKRRLFQYLCYGQQQSFNFNKKPNELQKIFLKLKEKVNQINQQIKNRKNNGKKQTVAYAMIAQWRQLLNLIGKPQNTLLRKSIIDGKLNIQICSKGNQIDFIDFLPVQRQNEINSQCEKICRSAVVPEKKIYFQIQEDPTLKYKFNDDQSETQTQYGKNQQTDLVQVNEFKRSIPSQQISTLQTQINNIYENKKRKLNKGH